MAFTWYGLEIDLYPYLKEKFQQGLVWAVVTQNLPAKNLHHLWYRRNKGGALPSVEFVTHAGTFYNVLLPQIRKSELTQIMCVEVFTEYWNEERGAYQFCETYIRQGRPDDTEMKIKIVLKHPKKG